ncbi:MAG TPA: GrpB family protein, partial [Patescibacteria group bacterium]|nr:GrpB family protein [Patescibacteria group bacterium]
QDWREIINFRDYLLRHPEKVEEYAEIKKKAAQKAQGEQKKYKEYKQDFIDDILKQLNLKK